MWFTTQGCGFDQKTKSRCGFPHSFPINPTLIYHFAAGCLPLYFPFTSPLFHSFSAPRAHREVSFGCEPLGEVVEGIWLGTDWVAVAMDLVEQVRRLVQAVIADVHILFFYILRPSCGKDQKDKSCRNLCHYTISDE